MDVSGVRNLEIRLLSLVAVAVLGVVVVARSGTAQGPEATPPVHDHGAKAPCGAMSASPDPQPGSFDGIQIETSDMKLYEDFFETILRLARVQDVDHPQTDKIRGYCYKGIEIVVRQDLAKPRPTGWVQLNFAVGDVMAVKEELEKAYAASPVSKRDEGERAKVVRFRLKPDVMRSNRKANRLEVYGPEGFLIGFNQYTD
jgi:hypothetical protein